MPILAPILVEHILEGYALPRKGIHGVAHWARVLENGRRLAAATEGADLEIIELFALFHDSRRLNESIDWNHGKRGGELASQLRGQYFELDDRRFALLQYACREHTAGKTRAEASVQVCWDSDRLDLLRVGIRPRPQLLCTAASRLPDMLEWANRRAEAFEVPELIGQEWKLEF